MLVMAFEFEVDREDVGDARRASPRTPPAAVGREVRRLGRVEIVQREALLDLARDDVLHDQRAVLLGADEEGEAIARAGPGQPRHGVPAAPGWQMYSKPSSWSKPGVRLRMTRPSLVDSRTMSISRSLRLPVIAASRSPDGDGSTVRPA